MNYQVIYNNLVKTRQGLNRRRGDGCVYEKHHILPKSMGGCDNKSNLILFTPREHFIAHRLLEKITKGTKHHYKMLKAVKFMSEENGNTQYKPTSRTYQKIREDFIVSHNINLRSNLYKGDGSISLMRLAPYFTKNLTDKCLGRIDKRKLVEAFPNIMLRSSKKNKKVLMMFFTLLKLGFRKFRGVLPIKHAVKLLMETGHIKKVNGMSVLTQKFEDFFKDNIRTPTTVGIFKKYLEEDGVTKGAKGLTEHKIRLREYNETNPDNLCKLVYLNGSYYLQPLLSNAPN